MTRNICARGPEIRFSSRDRICEADSFNSQELNVGSPDEL